MHSLKESSLKTGSPCVIKHISLSIFMLVVSFLTSRNTRIGVFNTSNNVPTAFSKLCLNCTGHKTPPLLNSQREDGNKKWKKQERFQSFTPFIFCVQKWFIWTKLIIWFSFCLEFVLIYLFTLYGDMIDHRSYFTQLTRMRLSLSLKKFKYMVLHISTYIHSDSSSSTGT